METPSARYRRAAQFAPLGEAGQLQLERSRVLICGCGALGSMIAERLARSGVGHLRIVDRDWVEHTNLQVKLSSPKPTRGRVIRRLSPQPLL